MTTNTLFVTLIVLLLVTSCASTNPNSTLSFSEGLSENGFDLNYLRNRLGVEVLDLESVAFDLYPLASDIVVMERIVDIRGRMVIRTTFSKFTGSTEIQHLTLSPAQFENRLELIASFIDQHDVRHLQNAVIRVGVPNALR